MSWERIRYSLVAILCIMLSACSSVKYVATRDVSGLESASFINDYPKNSKQLGAIVLMSSDENGEKQAGKAFVLRKDHSTYMAETLITDNGNDRKASFKRSYFSFGADKRNNVVGLKLRFVY